MNYDAIIIGGGHNGLVCACYLARGGLKTLVLERHGIVGGAAVTEEFHPGFRNSTASYTVSLLNPKVIRELHLAEHGLRIVERPLANFLPLPESPSGSPFPPVGGKGEGLYPGSTLPPAGGKGEGPETGGGKRERNYLKVGPDTVSTQREFAKFNQRDAERLPAFEAMLERAADALRELALTTPPAVGAGLPAMFRAARDGRKLWKLPRAVQRDLLALFTRSAAEFLDGWFESEPVRAVFGFDAVVGNYASPYTPGSAYVLLHHVFGEVNGKRGAWGHAIGGMGAITQAMAHEAERLGVEIRLNAAVAEVLVENNRAVGVTLESGERIAAKRIVSGIHPKLLFGKLIAPEHLDEDFNARIARYKSGSGTLRMNVALAELPEFSCLPGAGPHHGAGIIMAPSLDYMDRAYEDARRNGCSREPIVEMVISSTLDDSLAPPGKHVASLFCQHFAPQLPDGRSWDDERDAAAEAVIDTVNRFAPNFRASILGKMVLTPLDLERRFGLVGGDIFHGALTLDQLGPARPVLGHGDYRGPLRGLYLCGSGSHPGGGVTGLPGHNAAREILRDATWWKI